MERTDDGISGASIAEVGTGWPECIGFAVGDCSLGAILVARSERGVCAILLGDDRRAVVAELLARFPLARLVGGEAEAKRALAQAIALVEEPGSRADFPLDLRGTPFQRRVWQALREIPSGETASYADIAERIAAPGSSRAVARACAANAIAVAIPCHRVRRKDGSLAGFRWGSKRKRALLERERGVAR